jgi:cytoskeleton protein RodZ
MIVSDVTDNTIPTEEVAPVVSVGRVLGLAREQAGLSLEEAATQLRLSVRQVAAIEADDAATLPAPTFVRGFIRNYAKLLNLNPDELLLAYPGNKTEAKPVNIALHSENIPILMQEKKPWMPYAIASLIVGVALVVWVAYMEYASGDLDKFFQAKNTSHAMPVPVAVAPNVQQPIQMQETTPQQVAAMATTEPEATQPTQPPVASNTSNAKLVFNVTVASWINVTDRDGKELLNKSQPAGSQVTVEGNPPLSIVVGNMGGVQLTFNDKPIDLAAYAKANVARLTLE